MPINISEWSRIMRASLQARRDRIKVLMAGGADYKEAVRQVDYPHATAEEFAQFYDKYTAEYTSLFTQPETKDVH